MGYYIMFGFLGVLVLMVLWVIATYNSLVVIRERVGNAMGQISTQIESRWDAMKSLIEAAKSYEKHESETLENVTKLRTSVANNSSVNDINKDEQLFNDTLSKLMVVVEKYPDLKASPIYEKAMNSLNDYENNVRHSRMIYNDVVTKFNTKIAVFPSSIIAGIFNFSKMDYFKHTEEKKDIPTW